MSPSVIRSVRIVPINDRVLNLFLFMIGPVITSLSMIGFPKVSLFMIGPAVMSLSKIGLSGRLYATRGAVFLSLVAQSPSTLMPITWSPSNFSWQLATPNSGSLVRNPDRYTTYKTYSSVM